MPADPVKEFEAYRDELLARLGDGDPVEVLARTPAQLEARLSGLTEDVLAKRPRAGAWSVKEIIGHLGDSEWVYGYRMRLMLSHERPAIAGYDQDVMVAGMAHGERPISMLPERRSLPEDERPGLGTGGIARGAWRGERRLEYPITGGA
jgi:hypothetical protein